MGKTLKQSSSGSVAAEPTYVSKAFPSNANCNAVTRRLKKVSHWPNNALKGTQTLSYIHH